MWCIKRVRLSISEISLWKRTDIKWFIKSRILCRFERKSSRRKFERKACEYSSSIRDGCLLSKRKSKSHIRSKFLATSKSRWSLRGISFPCRIKEQTNTERKKKRWSTGLAGQLVSLLKTRSTCTRTRLYRQTDRKRERERERERDHG